MTTLLIIVLVLLAVGAAPSWGYSTGWGAIGGLGLVVVILIILLLLGRI